MTKNSTSYKKGQSGNPDGRPAMGLEVLPENWQELITEIAKEGGSMNEMRVSIGLKNNTFYNMQDRHPEFKEAIDEARSLSEIWWEKQGRAMVTGAPGNARVWEKNMQNRFGWRDKTDVDIRTPDGVQVNQRFTLDDFYGGTNTKSGA